MWFEDLTGFAEKSPVQVRKNLSLEGDKLISKVNHKEFIYGSLEISSLSELRKKVQSLTLPVGKISVQERVADVQELHKNTENIGSLFQVASQFNLLEMAHPDVTPDNGIGQYEYDLTQGPACAVAAGAGTIYRNYFANVNGEIGQSAHNQIDTLSAIGKALNNSSHNLWEMKNGYALASLEGLKIISEKLTQASEQEIDELRQLLKIGLQWNTEVTISDSKHLISQAYCSALPVAYSQHSSLLWEKFACLILEAAYEATLCAAIINSVHSGNNKVFLTLLGGGAFGNELSWIIKAIKRALTLYKDVNLQVFIVSYGRSNHQVKELLESKL